MIQQTYETPAMPPPTETVLYPRPTVTRMVPPTGIRETVEMIPQRNMSVTSPQYPYVGVPQLSPFDHTAQARFDGPAHPNRGNNRPIIQSPVQWRSPIITETVQAPGAFTQVIPMQPARPAVYLPLDRIHENGHPDVTRYTTEEFKVFHKYLTKSTEEGRSFRGTWKIEAEDIPNIQEKLMEVLKYDDNTTNLPALLSICELSNLRDGKCVDFFTQNGLYNLLSDVFDDTMQLPLGPCGVNDQINHPELYLNFNLLLDATQRFTENDQELARRMGKGVIARMLDFVRDPFFNVEALNRDDDKLKWMSRRELLKKVFTLLYNCIRNHPGNRGVYRRERASELLKPFLDSRFYILRAKALFILAYIVTEEENIDLNITSLNIEFIVKILRRTLEDPSHYSAHYNFFAVEVVEAVQRVAANDHNKDKFIEAGVLVHLVSLMDQKNSKEERNSALNALWVLSFTASFKDTIANEKDCIENVRACMGVEDYKQTCQAILWNLRDKVDTPLEMKTKEDKDNKPEEGAKDDAGSKEVSPPAEGAPPNTESKVISRKPPHVMISYQWDVQKQIVKVKDILTAHGFNVWLDIERMEGSTLEAMANAVEEACVIIICFSEKYKDSPFCRTEAEYAYKLRKAIVPLKMQTGYDPNGWLGAMLGTKLYIQMNTLELVQQNMGNLVRELDGRGRTLTPDDGDDDGEEEVYIPGSIPRPVGFTEYPRRASIMSNTTLILPPAPMPTMNPRTMNYEQCRPRTASPRVLPSNVVPGANRTAQYGRQSSYMMPTAAMPSHVLTEDVYVERPLPVAQEAATCLKIMQEWNTLEVVNWLRRNNYSHLQDWFQNYTGEDIVGLKMIAVQAPEFFFGKLERDLGFKSLLEMIRFKKMLDNIY